MVILLMFLLNNSWRNSVPLKNGNYSRSLLAVTPILTVRRLSFFLSLDPFFSLFLPFFAKSFVVSSIFATFVAELERTEKNGRDEASND